jgi:hypothetical protein
MAESSMSKVFQINASVLVASAPLNSVRVSQSVDDLVSVRVELRMSCNNVRFPTCFIQRCGCPIRSVNNHGA